MDGGPYAVSPKAVYGCTALLGVNKKGLIYPDSQGYYTVVVGAVGAFNSYGAYYPFEPARKLFESSGSLMRRIQSGCCKGEMGHPKPLPGQSPRDFIQRVMQIEETRVCCHFRKLWLEENGYTDAQKRPVVAILGEVAPSGPFGPAFKASMENPNENVCFSIRSLTQDSMTPAGYLQKDLKTIITFDVVTEGGIHTAQKWFAPTLESLQEHHFFLDDLESVVKYPPRGASLEGSLTQSLQQLIKQWTPIQQKPRRTAPPRSAQWTMD